MTHSYNDQARLIIASLGDRYTTRDVQDELGGYAYTSQILRQLALWGEIEVAGHDGRAIVWQTIQLRRVRQPKAAASAKQMPTARTRKDDAQRDVVPQLSDAERRQHDCSRRLHAALDAITRRQHAEARHV